MQKLEIVQPKYPPISQLEHSTAASSTATAAQLHKGRHHFAHHFALILGKRKYKYITPGKIDGHITSCLISGVARKIFSFLISKPTLTNDELSMRREMDP
jgi:hypothetical protein